MSMIGNRKYDPQIVGGCVIAALVFLIGCPIIGYFHTHKVAGHVTRHRWERRIEVQQLRTFRENDWSVPAGGRQLRSYMAVRSYIYVKCGRSSVAVPVMGTKYEYDIDRWVYARTLKRGDDGLEPAWPATDGLSVGTAVGCERTAAQYEDYWLVIDATEDDGTQEHFEYSLDPQRWREHPDGEALILDVNHFHQLRHIGGVEDTPGR